MSTYQAVGTGFVFPPEWKQAATLLLVVGTEADRSVVLTERARHLALHPGDMALPGGRVKDGETTWQTALREAQEELGIDTTAIEEVGFLGYFRAAGSRYRIAAHVGQLPSLPELHPDPNEVAHVVLVPFRTVIDPDRYSEVDSPRTPNSRTILFHYPEYPQGRIFGATARMLLAFAQRFDRGEYAASFGRPAAPATIWKLPPQV